MHLSAWPLGVMPSLPLLQLVGRMKPAWKALVGSFLYGDDEDMWWLALGEEAGMVTTRVSMPRTTITLSN